MAPERIRYGDDASQWADLYRPDGASRGVVVVVHGGFWRARYDLDYGRPLAVDLAAHGFAAWNIEYRRVGNGGGWPTTCDDVAAGIDRLADVPGLDLSGPVVTLGHSAGGHLATWAASRGRSDRWWPVRVPVTAVVSQAGVLDLRRAHAERQGDGAVQGFLGEPPGPDHAAADPQQQLPLDVPVFCVHGRGDDVVPLHFSEAYVAAARAAGAPAQLHVVDGDHFTVIDTASPAWAWTVEQLVSL